MRSKLIFFIIILLIIGLGIVYLKYYNKEKSGEKSDVEKYFPQTSVKISVINGSGIDFAARNVKNYILENYKKVYVIYAKNIAGGKYNFDKCVIVIKKKNKENKLKYLQALTGIKRRIFAFNEDDEIIKWVEDKDNIINNIDGFVGIRDGHRCVVFLAGPSLRRGTHHHLDNNNRERRTAGDNR